MKSTFAKRGSIWISHQSQGAPGEGEKPPEDIIIIIIHDNIEEAAIPTEAKGYHASLSPISFQDPSAEIIVVLPPILSPVADNFDVPDIYDVPMVMPYILQLPAAGILGPGLLTKVRG